MIIFTIKVTVRKTYINITIIVNHTYITANLCNWGPILAQHLVKQANSLCS